MYAYICAVDFNIIKQKEWDKTKIPRRRKISSKDFYVALTLGKFTKQSEVEHLFDAHYRASRPRRRIIRVYGGVRGAGAVGDLARGLYSPLRRPATSTSPYSVRPTWRSIPFSLLPPPYSPVSFPPGARARYPSPFLSTLSSTNYLRRWRSSSSALRIAISPVLCIRCTFGYHPRRFILCRSSSKLEEVMAICTLWRCLNHFVEYFA